MKHTPQQLADYDKAIKLLIEARDLFNKIGKENQRDYDADRYAAEIDTLLETDNGEAGLIPFVNLISK